MEEVFFNRDRLLWIYYYLHYPKILYVDRGHLRHAISSSFGEVIPGSIIFCSAFKILAKGLIITLYFGKRIIRITIFREHEWVISSAGTAFFVAPTFLHITQMQKKFGMEDSRPVAVPKTGYPDIDIGGDIARHTISRGCRELILFEYWNTSWFSFFGMADLMSAHRGHFGTEYLIGRRVADKLGR